jgi:hypothetical protein
VSAIDMAYSIYYTAVLRGGLVFGEEHELYAMISNQILVTELKSALTHYLRGDNLRWSNEGSL